MGAPPIEQPPGGFFYPHRTGFDHGRRLASDGGPPGVPKGKRRDTKRRRRPRKR